MTESMSERQYEWLKEFAKINGSVTISYNEICQLAPVVRCEECRFNKGDNKCLHLDSIIKVPADGDFCSYGRRREE